MAAVLTLRSTYTPRPRDDSNGSVSDEWWGTFDLELGPLTPADFPPGSRLVLWSTMLLVPTEASGAAVVDRTAGLLTIEPTDGARLAADTWVIPEVRSTFPARHANDGPEAAYVVTPSGQVIPVAISPTDRTDRPRSRPPSDEAPGAADERAALVPYPRELSGLVGRRGRQIELGQIDVVRSGVSVAEVRATWEAIEALATRLGSRRDHSGDGANLAVSIVIDDAVPHEAGYELRLDASGAVVATRTIAGVRNALTTLAQLAADGLPDQVLVRDEPVLELRIVHLDVARRWYEPAIVSRLIDVAAWRKFTHVHLHLTDDEAWRFPVRAFPALGDIGGTRGHGLPLPPLCGSGPEPTGRCYTADEIGGWVQQADALGVVLVPEVDLPAHSHAALTALAHLRDPDDTSNAFSVQGYRDNVLVPGHPATEAFVTEVFRTLAELFPSSPVLHIGGDEVPAGAWAGSPIAREFASARGLHSTAAIEAAFHRETIDLIRRETGREVAMWEEAALAGAGRGAYAIAWTSAASAAHLTAAGHDVVMAPGQAYYLDMASGRDWSQPGSSWAGNVPLETTCAFDPFEGWDAAGPGRLVGVQACMWSEHIADVSILDALAFPRLDAVAERGWTGEIVGGAPSLARRSSALPRFTP